MIVVSGGMNATWARESLVIHTALAYPITVLSLASHTRRLVTSCPYLMNYIVNSLEEYHFIESHKKLKPKWHFDFYLNFHISFG